MRVLAIGCHPDDLEIGCGGTLAKYADSGDDVFMCHIANGNMGHAVLMPDELRIIRTEEAECSGAMLGAKQVFNIDIPDLVVDSSNEQTVKRVIEVIREVKPDVMIIDPPRVGMHKDVVKEIVNIRPERITAAGRSMFFPVAPNTTVKGRANNRRIEIILTPNLEELYNLTENTVNSQ